MSASTHQADSDSERLKAEGNALFSKSDFAGAYKKYTSAIELDSKNAILYCNRAACAFGLGRYIDSCTDATKATELDPSYAKAWGRLAQANTSMNYLDGAIRAWKRAVAVLPVENLTPAQKRQRDNYTAELAAAQAKLAGLRANIKPLRNFTATGTWESLPWNRATVLIPGLQATQQWNSSAWVITKAHRAWQKGMDQIKAGQPIPTPPLERSGDFGQLSAIAELVNTLIIDDRAFNMSQPDWLNLYNRQLYAEVTAAKGWSDNGARKIMQEIPARLKADGWDAVRPAISITVIGWVMRAFIEDRIKDNIETALDFFTSALDLLCWGKELWKDVSLEEKGEVFRPAFIRGVRCLHLQALLRAYNKDASRFPLKDILVGADEQLRDLEGAPEQPGDTEDFGTFLSAFRYPRGQAHALRGFYHNHAANLRAVQEVPSRKLITEVKDELMVASTEYLKAADYYPIDDEKHAWYLHMAFDVLSQTGGPLDYLLTIQNRLHDSLPRMKQIWEIIITPKADVCDDFAADTKHREELLRLARGKSKSELSRIVTPRWSK